MGMIRKQVHITPEQNAALASISRRRRVPESELVRQALDALIRAEEPRPKQDWMLKMARRARDLGPPDLAENHDAYLVQADEERSLRRQ